MTDETATPEEHYNWLLKRLRVSVETMRRKERDYMKSPNPQRLRSLTIAETNTDELLKLAQEHEHKYMMKGTTE